MYIKLNLYQIVKYIIEVKICNRFHNKPDKTLSEVYFLGKLQGKTKGNLVITGDLLPSAIPSPK